MTNTPQAFSGEDKSAVRALVNEFSNTLPKGASTPYSLREQSRVFGSVRGTRRPPKMRPQTMAPTSGKRQ